MTEQDKTRIPQYYISSPKRILSTAEKTMNGSSATDRINELEEQVHRLRKIIVNNRIDPELDVPILQTDFKNKTSQNILKWSLCRRGQYLQAKVEKLKIQRQNQYEFIRKSRESKLQDNNCKKISCYYKRYIKLIKYRCPTADY